MTIFDDGSNVAIAVALVAATGLGAILAVIRFGRLPMPDPLGDEELTEQLIDRYTVHDSQMP